MTLRTPHCELTLLPDKALLVGSTLVLADTHFGKSATFRRRGIPVPEGETAADTRRIRELVDRHHPDRFVIAGDLLHARLDPDEPVVEKLTAFFASLPCETHLVLGNHDRRSGALPASWPVEVHDALALPGFAVVHDPADARPGEFCICGHLHPVVRIREGAGSNLRVPCFWLHRETLVLPSFGTFTGGSLVRPAPSDRIFIPVRDQVRELPADLC